jgi:hypothetical protein
VTIATNAKESASLLHWGRSPPALVPRVDLDVLGEEDLGFSMRMALLVSGRFDRINGAAHTLPHYSCIPQSDRQNAPAIIDSRFPPGVARLDR